MTCNGTNAPFGGKLQQHDSLFKFLSGWFGEPPLYMLERGHPRLRMRHTPYAIG